MKRNAHSKKGYTLIELMLVVAIIGVLASIVMPRFDLVLQAAYQSAARNNLGSIRSAIGLYYSEQEGVYPFQGEPDGYPDAMVPPTSLSEVLCPRYIAKLPTPRLADRGGDVNGIVGLRYDPVAKSHMESNPVKDVILMADNSESTLGMFRPYAYDHKNGVIVINNDNWDVKGNEFYKW